MSYDDECRNIHPLNLENNYNCYNAFKTSLCLRREMLEKSLNSSTQKKKNKNFFPKNRSYRVHSGSVNIFILFFYRLLSVIDIEVMPSQSIDCDLTAKRRVVAKTRLNFVRVHGTYVFRDNFTNSYTLTRC